MSGEASWHVSEWEGLGYIPALGVNRNQYGTKARSTPTHNFSSSLLLSSPRLTFHAPRHSLPGLFNSFRRHHSSLWGWTTSWVSHVIVLRSSCFLKFRWRDRTLSEATSHNESSRRRKVISSNQDWLRQPLLSLSTYQLNQFQCDFSQIEVHILIWDRRNS